MSVECLKIANMEKMRTLNCDVLFSLVDGVQGGDIPHLLTLCGVLSLVVISGRPPLCLHCNNVGHIRRNCRTPRCDHCRCFGHSAVGFVVVYANTLRLRTQHHDDTCKSVLWAPQSSGCNRKHSVNDRPYVLYEQGSIRCKQVRCG